LVVAEVIEIVPSAVVSAVESAATTAGISAKATLIGVATVTIIVQFVVVEAATPTLVVEAAAAAAVTVVAAAKSVILATSRAAAAKHVAATFTGGAAIPGIEGVVRLRSLRRSVTIVSRGIPTEVVSAATEANGWDAGGCRHAATAETDRCQGRRRRDVRTIEIAAEI